MNVPSVLAKNDPDAHFFWRSFLCESCRAWKVTCSWSTRLAEKFCNTCEKVDFAQVLQNFLANLVYEKKMIFFSFSFSIQRKNKIEIKEKYGWSDINSIYNSCAFKNSISFWGKTLSDKQTTYEYFKFESTKNYSDQLW